MFDRDAAERWYAQQARACGCDDPSAHTDPTAYADTLPDASVADTLGPCGCRTYHMSDCPLVVPYLSDPYDEPDDDYNPDLYDDEPEGSV